MSSREETAFLRGDIGVDGLPVEPEDQDEAELERGKAVAALAKNRAYLGRELLTWALWRSVSGDPLFEHEGEGVIVLVVGKVVLRGLAGEATELAVKGHTSGYSEVVRYAIDKGLLVHAARLRFQLGEQVFEATVDADTLSVRAATIPKALAEEDDEQLTERLWLTERLGALIDGLWARFLAVRATRAWHDAEVPALKAWLAGTR
jgi:hypothetical protein